VELSYSTVELPYGRVYVNTDDPVEEENLLEFRLLYQGELPPSGNKRRPKEKHAIRRVFHPQLRRLWSVKPNLRFWAFHWFGKAPTEAAQAINEKYHQDPEEIGNARFRLGIETMGKFYARAGYDIAPLVVPEWGAQCSIDILVLRPGGRVVFDEQGDLDGQVRTILDALRMPDTRAETGGAQPVEDEHPLFCLLQDDKLISEIKVTADELLQLPEQAFNPSERAQAVARINQMSYGKLLPAEDKTALDFALKILEIRGPVRPHDAFVVVHVKLSHRDARTFDNYLGS
jgi:hypothetical protein